MPSILPQNSLFAPVLVTEIVTRIFLHYMLTVYSLHDATYVDSVMHNDDKPFSVSLCTQDTWEAVRVLDEAENWAVRNEVVTKSSHNELVGIAKVKKP